MFIDRETGVLSLGDLQIAGGMTPADFDEVRDFRKGGSSGKRSWYRASGYEGYVVSVTFEKELLTNASVIYEPLPGAARKLHHDGRLRGMLGEPTSNRPYRSGCLFWKPPKSIGEVRELQWQFPWGTVTSSLEGREFEPEIWIRWKRRL